jgi:acyl carrier protein
MDETTIKQQLKEWIANRSKIRIADGQLTDDTRILEAGYLSSLDIVEFVLYIESLRGEEVDLDDLEPEVFESTNTMYQTFFAGA